MQVGPVGDLKWSYLSFYGACRSLWPLNLQCKGSFEPMKSITFWGFQRITAWNCHFCPPGLSIFTRPWYLLRATCFPSHVARTTIVRIKQVSNTGGKRSFKQWFWQSRPHVGGCINAHLDKINALGRLDKINECNPIWMLYFWSYELLSSKFLLQTDRHMANGPCIHMYFQWAENDLSLCQQVGAPVWYYLTLPFKFLWLFYMVKIS